GRREGEIPWRRSRSHARQVDAHSQPRKAIMVAKRFFYVCAGIFLLALSSLPAPHTVLAQDYVYVTQWGSGDGEYWRPFGVAIDGDGNLFVSETDSDRIRKFTSTGVLLAKWGAPGTIPGTFEFPAGVATDAAGNVYVADKGNG